MTPRSYRDQKKQNIKRKITQAWLKGSVLKTESRGNPSGGSNPSSSAIYFYRGMEQLVARRAHNPKVVGSSPAPATIYGPIAKLVIAPPCHGGDHEFESRWGRHYFCVKKELIRNTVVKALPILLNETLYAVGQVLQVKLKAEYSYDALNANAMFETIQMAFFSPLYHGINAGIAVFVGNQLGAGNLENARYNGRHLVRLSILIGAIFGLSLVGASFALPGLIFTGSTSNAQHMGTQLMLIYGAIYPVVIINNGCYSILRAGLP
ncbi:hypothetical protein FQR65_LT16662 [Abscondita terminalis]|nr:hypothetical protein FQR65_LT16662 [Abscondita terminalis]